MDVALRHLLNAMMQHAQACPDLPAYLTKHLHRGSGALGANFDASLECMAMCAECCLGHTYTRDML